MIKFNFFLLFVAATLGYSQTPNYAKAPNSYIYDLDRAHAENFDGLDIPVIKAYEMWSKYEYLKTDGQPTPIPAGVQSASLYWEDLPGLITSVNIVPGAEPSDSKIRVKVNKGVGKGNAVIAFKVDGTIYWSWHIWVTDNPDNGVTYGHGTETDISGNPISIKYMDRNLGATSGSFLDDQWQKSGGLMYEWGRKDPFPPLVYKDAHYYAISGEVGTLRHKQIDPVNTIPVEVRPFNEIEKNIQYSVKNPIKYILNTDATGNWFSSSRYKVPGTSPNYITWDLWSDNAKGGNSNGNSSNTTLRNESRSYELKSELDPCPNGWRVPSYLGRETQNNNLAFFGKHDWNNDDIVVMNRQLFPDVENPNLYGIKVYPGLGMDFTLAQAGARNLGMLPVSGGYVYYPNAVAPNAPVGVTFQDQLANGGLWSATYAYDGARLFSMISDPQRTNTSVGLHAIYNNLTNPTKAGNAVRCMKDPNLAQIGDFATEYFAAQNQDFTVGLDNPNSYIVINESHLSIPVSKAFSVYNQLLSDHGVIYSNAMLAKVLWTTNDGLIVDVSINVNPTDGRLSTIEVELDPNEKGNAVISLHGKDRNNPAFWSWHIWAPEDDPTANPVTYTTEAEIPVLYNFENASVSTAPPLTTVFMDRNLGAQSSDINSGNADGLHYQWGRKDPIPTFRNPNYPINIYGGEIELGPQSAILVKKTAFYKTLDWKYYLRDYTDPYEKYGSKNPVEHLRVRENLIYSIGHPMRFLYHKNLGELYNGGNHYANDLSKIKDWISNQRGQASNRWGHADKKSPFDPCPEGWRVPDVSFTHLYSGSKGNSPWYNGYKLDAYGNPGVIQDQWHNIGLFYGGTVAGNNGWKFENPDFKIGNFYKDGIRGELGENLVSLVRSGVWTAAMADLNTGYALAMQFQDDKMQTATGVYPQAAMSVRCAKDEKRLLGVPRQNSPQPHMKDSAPEKVIVAIENEMKVYPNPFTDEFMVSSSNAKTFELYDFSGKLLMKGTLDNGKVNGASLQKGMYLLKITMKDGSTYTKKMMKK